MQTKYKDIPGYEGKYSISIDGVVISNNYNSKNKVLKGNINSSGYKYVTLSNNGSSKMFFVHRLVMLTFVGYSELCVNHKNGIKTDNRLENLEYITRSENQLHAYRNGLQVPIGKRVGAFKNGVLVKEFNLIADACREYGLHTSNIIKAINGGYSHCGGFTWKYL